MNTTFTFSPILVKVLCFTSLSLILQLGRVRACPVPTWIGDGYCDPDCNNLENEWDGGDCCEEDCVNNDYDCGYNGFDCKEKQENRYLLVKEYSGFELTLQCDKSAQAGYAVGYSYSLTRDRADLGTKRSYPKDRSLPDECQQKSGDSYKTAQCKGGARPKNQFCYDRGHIVMANHMDGTSQTRKDASFVTNLLPQASGFNQDKGAWKETEDIIECHRDFDEVDRLEIFGGMVYDDESNDFFIGSHGIPTPDLYYKVVVKYFKNSSKDPDVIAWLMENKSTEVKSKLDRRYGDDGVLIKASRLKRIVDDPLSSLPGTFTESAYEAGESWDRPGNCSKGKLGSNDEL